MGQLGAIFRYLAICGACGVCLTLAAGCAVPDVDRTLAKVDVANPANPQVADPRIVGADGPLSPNQSAALLEDVADDADQPALLDRHRAIEEAVAGSPLTAGNTTHLLRDGEETFAAVFDAIRGAKHHVNLEYYTLEDIDVDGERLSDLLIAKRQAGVSVNVIYDSYGSSETPVGFFERLKAAGINVLEFHPANPLEAVAGGYSPNDRDHRKIMIVDGQTGIVGGVNLALYYQSKRPGSDSAGEQDDDAAEAGVPAADALPKTWRDVALRIDGPAVAQLQRLFLGHWKSGGGPQLDQAGFFPDLPVKDGEVVRIIGSSPQQEISRYYVTLISAIRSAERRVWLTTAYFVPTSDEIEALEAAAERGVDVRLMLPADSDAGEAVAIARSHFSDLLEAGVRIFEVSGVVLHSKTVTIDGVWSAIGSSNFDHRSVLFNDEVDAVVLGGEVAHGLQKRFAEDQKVATEITLAAWRERPLADRLRDAMIRPWQSLF